MLLKGVRRKDSRCKDKKSPISVEIMLKFWLNCKPELGLILWTGFSLAFCALLRKSELLALTWNNLRIDKSNTLWITIVRSKTDQFGNKVELPLSCICSKPWCPIHTILALLRQTKSGAYGVKKP